MIPAPSRQAILGAFLHLPAELRAPRASGGDIEVFELEFGTIPTDFRWFLTSCGGGPVGSEWVNGIKELASSHRKFQRESHGDPGWKWTMRGVFIIGWDGWGNPFGICAATGRILVEDHDSGTVVEMAASLQAFLEDGLRV